MSANTTRPSVAEPQAGVGDGLERGGLHGLDEDAAEHIGGDAMAEAVGAVERLAAITALVVMLIAFVSPLCALASALFSARVLHHILLVTFLTPLVVLSIPPRSRERQRLPAQLSFMVHTILMWVWHAPGPYLFALSSPAAYWLMELTLIGSALWLWADILSPRRSAGAALALLLGTDQIGQNLLHFFARGLLPTVCHDALAEKRLQQKSAKLSLYVFAVGHP